jgi:uncharacterized protein YjbI with pentapeptide repeats
VAVVLGAWFRRTAARALRVEYRPLLRHPVLAGAPVLLVCLVISYGAINGERREPGHWYEEGNGGLASGIKRTVPRLLPFVAARAFADIRDQDVSTKPANWFFRPERDLPEIITRAQLRGADLRSASAQAAFLVKADLREARLSGANFSRAQFQAADLQEADLQKTYLFRAKLQGARLSNANLAKAYLGEADLEKADLREARLQGAFLIAANLREADLRMAQVQDALLTRAKLGGARLFGAQLQGANLEYATDLTQQQIAGVCVDARTILPGHLRRPEPCTGTPGVGGRSRGPNVVAAPTVPIEPACVGNLCTMTIKSNASIAGAAVGAPGEPTNEIVTTFDTVGEKLTLVFQPVLVGRFWTFTPVPSDAPSGAEVVHIPPGDGRSGFFKATFVLPQSFFDIQLSGRVNIDDVGRVFVNRTPISASIFCVDSLDRVTQYGDVKVFADDDKLFHAGVNEILVSVANVGGGPSGGAFYFVIRYSAAGAPGKASGKAQSKASRC